MTRQDIEKLLGGYATGTLTPEEEQALFAAALEDQQLFDTLLREQPLRDLLQDPTARASLLAALTEERVPWYRRFVWELVAGAAVLFVAVPLLIWRFVPLSGEPPVLMTAQVAPAVTAPPEARPMMPSTVPLSEHPPARVRVKPSAKPAARQVESGPEPPSAPQAVAGNAIGQLEATTGAVAPRAKDVAVKANPPGVAGGATQSFGTTSVEVTAEQVRAVPVSPSSGFLPSQAPPNMRANLGAATSMMAAKAALAHLKWTVLRRQPDGEFAVADPFNLQSGDTVKLRLEAEESGYVHVVEGQKVLSSPINPGKPFETTIEPQGAGTHDVEFWFTRRAVLSQVSDSAPTVDPPHPPSTHVTLTYK